MTILTNLYLAVCVVGFTIDWLWAVAMIAKHNGFLAIGVWPKYWVEVDLDDPLVHCLLSAVEYAVMSAVTTMLWPVRLIVISVDRINQNWYKELVRILKDEE